jgi:hypothetical protein
VPHQIANHECPFCNGALVHKADFDHVQARQKLAALESDIAQLKANEYSIRELKRKVGEGADVATKVPSLLRETEQRIREQLAYLDEATAQALRVSAIALYALLETGIVSADQLEAALAHADGTIFAESRSASADALRRYRKEHGRGDRGNART